MKKNLRAANIGIAYSVAFLGRGTIRNARQKALVRTIWELLASRSGRAELRKLFTEARLNKEVEQAALKHIEHLDMTGSCGSA